MSNLLVDTVFYEAVLVLVHDAGMNSCIVQTILENMSVRITIIECVWRLRYSIAYSFIEQESCAIAKMTMHKCIGSPVVQITAIRNYPRWRPAGRHLGFDVTRNSAIRSANPQNPILEPNMKCIGSPVVEIWPFAYLGGIWNPILGKGKS